MSNNMTEISDEAVDYRGGSRSEQARGAVARRVAPMDVETRETMREAAEIAWANNHYSSNNAGWFAVVDAVLALVPDAVPSSQTADWVLKDRDEAHAYLRRLFEHCAPQCTPLPDLLGLCTQIDNYIAGLRDVRSAPLPSIVTGAMLDAFGDEWSSIGLKWPENATAHFRTMLNAALAVGHKDQRHAKSTAAIPNAETPPAPDPRLEILAACPAPYTGENVSRRASALHSLLSELLTRVAALERGR